MISSASVHYEGGTYALGAENQRGWITTGKPAHEQSKNSAPLQEERGIVAGEVNVKCSLHLFTVWSTSKYNVCMAEGVGTLP